MDDKEIRLRCIEAAARNPAPHAQGYSAGVLEAAQKFADWVLQKATVTVGVAPKFDTGLHGGVGTLHAKEGLKKVL